MKMTLSRISVIGISFKLIHVIYYIMLSSWVVMAADKELVKHQKEEDILQKNLGVQVTHSGQFPSTFLRISSNPLKDQPNLSAAKVKKRKAILGSKRAHIVTKMEYLKKQWCKTEPVKQQIKKQGCLTKTVINRFCYGQCNSFFIPRKRSAEIEKSAFKSCAFCRPKKTDFVRVTLNCPGRNIKRVRKKIQVIKSCNCMALNLD